MKVAELPIQLRFPACAFEVPMYPVTVCMIPCEHNQKRAGVITKLLPGISFEHVMHANYEAHASVITLDDLRLRWLMFVTACSKADLETMAHEAFHLTHRIMEHTQAEFSHEPYAYMHGYLFKTLTTITHSKHELQVDFSDAGLDMELITQLNEQHPELCLEPLDALNDRILKALEST